LVVLPMTVSSANVDEIPVDTRQCVTSMDVHGRRHVWGNTPAVSVPCGDQAFVSRAGYPQMVKRLVTRVRTTRARSHVWPVYQRDSHRGRPRKTRRKRARGVPALVIDALTGHELRQLPEASERLLERIETYI
jgi:hypothetical protein